MVIKRIFSSAYLLFVLVSVTGCQPSAGNPTIQPTESTSGPSVVIPDPTETPVEKSSLIFIDRTGNWDIVGDAIDAELISMASERDWDYVKFETIRDLSDVSNPALIVVVGGEFDFEAWIEAIPKIKVILIGVAGARPADGVAVIGAEGLRPDQTAFISGYIAAMVTPNWRVGVVGIGETGAGRAAIAGFINGAAFYCGLCRPAYPPFGTYPASAVVPSESQNHIQDGRDQLAAEAIQTIGLTPEFPSEEVALALSDEASASVYWIGHTAPTEATRNIWLATVAPNPEMHIETVYTQLESGEGEILLPMTFEIRDFNREILTEGKLMFLSDLIKDVEQGIIDTGIDPMSGSER